MKQTMSLYYTLSDFHQGTTGTSKDRQSSLDYVLGHNVCKFLNSVFLYKWSVIFSSTENFISQPEQWGQNEE